MAYEFLSLQGSSNIARNIDGKATILRELGNQTSVKLAIESETYERKETKSGKRQKVFEQSKSRGVTLEVTLDEQKRDDIALAFQAENVITGSKQVTGEKITTLKAGDQIKLEGFNLTSVTVKDSTSSGAKTLNEGEHYLLDKDYGILTLVSTDGITQPLSVDYMQGDVSSTVLFSLPDDAEYYYLFKGINSIDNKKISVELWRFKPSVGGEMELINEETGEITIKGSALADTNRQSDPKLGGFGRIVYL